VPTGVPTKAPTTGPTTRAPYRATEPPGFKRTTIDGRTFFLRDADAKWTAEVVAALSPTTRPTTMPADMIERATTNRAAIKQSMMTDLGLTDAAAVDKFYDNQLMPMLRQLDEIHPQLIYLVSDDSVLPFTYDPEAADDARRKTLSSIISETELRVMQSVAQRAFEVTIATFLQFVGATVFEPLKAKPDQEWFAVGVSGVLAAQYSAPIIGVPADQIITGLSLDDPRNPIRANTIDLLHPNDLQQMRTQFVPAYLAAFRARAMQAARLLIERAGPGGVAKILAAWKQTPPADGQALVNLIKQSTNVDMSGDLGSR
jgi:hypothetical protein